MSEKTEKKSTKDKTKGKGIGKEGSSSENKETSYIYALPWRKQSVACLKTWAKWSEEGEEERKGLEVRFDGVHT